MVITTRKILLITYLLSMVSRKEIKKHSPNTLGIPSFVDVLEVKHSIKGRVRFFAPIIKENPAYGVELVEKFKQFSNEDIYSLSVNSLTGSITVCYNPEKIDIMVLQGAIIKLLGMDEVLKNGRVSKISREVKDMIKALDTGLYDFTKGFLDLKTTVLATFLVGAYISYKAYGLMSPGAMTLIWWSSHLI